MRGAALIVLAWNQWTLTRRCLDSLLAQDLDAAEITSIVAFLRTLTGEYQSKALQ